MRLNTPACLLLLILCCLACTRGSGLPARPQLLTEDLGIGLHLLLPLADARALAGSKAGLVVKILKTDEKDQIAGYDLKLDSDEVVGIYFDAIPGVDDEGALAGRISEIRCFLNRGTASSVQLLGRPISSLGADDIEQILGPAVDRSDVGDGQIHLTYLFDPKVPGEQLQLRLITSHHLDQSCYAFAMSLMERP
jgi:hypothetical protein